MIHVSRLLSCKELWKEVWEFAAWLAVNGHREAMGGRSEWGVPNVAQSLAITRGANTSATSLNMKAVSRMKISASLAWSLKSDARNNGA